LTTLSQTVRSQSTCPCLQKKMPAEGKETCFIQLQTTMLDFFFF
jgi:hypothetical protein